MKTTTTTALLALGFLGACAEPAAPPSSPAGVVVAHLTVTSANFAPGSAMPIDQTCDGKNASPALTWSAPPEGTRSLAVVMDDLDASPPEYTHWLVYDLPPGMTKLPEGFEPVGGPNADLTGGNASVGLNDFKNTRYDGPCPPKERMVHRYRFRVLALDATLGIPTGADRATLDRAMNGHVLAEGLLKGAFAH